MILTARPALSAIVARIFATVCVFKAANLVWILAIGVNAECLYECQACGFDIFNLRFCNLCWSGCRDLTLCDHCFASSACFGSVGLKKETYCILNKKGTLPQNFTKTQAQIIADMKRRGEWGEFFPFQIAYLVTMRAWPRNRFPLIEARCSRVVGLGGRIVMNGDVRISVRPPRFRIASHLFQRISAQKVLKCEETGRPFKLVEPELQYYRRNNIPRYQQSRPDCVRDKRRLQFRNPRILWGRSCASCNQAIQTTYAPSRPEKVFCEACYQEHVYR